MQHRDVILDISTKVRVFEYPLQKSCCHHRADRGGEKSCRAEEDRKWAASDLNTRPPLCKSGIITRLDQPPAIHAKFHGPINCKRLDTAKGPGQIEKSKRLRFQSEFSINKSNTAYMKTTQQGYLLGFVITSTKSIL